MDENTNLMPNEANQASSLSIYKMGSDMKWTAIYLIVAGALTCVGIITALIGVPMIIAGLRMNEAARTFQDFSQSQDPNALSFAFDRQGKSFAILKILVILYIVLTVLSIVLSFAFLIPYLNNMPYYNGF